MQRNGSRRVLAASIAVLLASVPQAHAADVIVTVTPIPAPTISPFDPADPPTNPPLGSKESADTQESVKVNPGTPGFHEDVTPNANGSFTDTLTVNTATKVNVTGTDNIRIPDPSDPPSDSDKQLLDHEKGHAALDSNSFSRDAQKKTEEAFKGLNGMTFTGTGATKADAVTAARTALANELKMRSDAAQKEILRQATVLGNKYDDVTDHGLNDIGSIDTAQKGVDEALAERDKAPAAGSSPSSPDPSKKHASTAPDPATLTYDEASRALGFGGDLLLQYGSDPLDPLLGRGVVSIDAMLLIGLSDNGSYHLTDTELHITDSVTGMELLKAYIFEPAYMASTLPGFAGMIEGYLDIPPAFTGDVNNFIGSSLLDGLGTGFWFYLNDPLFDSNGNVLIASGDSIDGSLKFGTPTPEPSSAVLLILPLTLFVALHRRQMLATRKRWLNRGHGWRTQNPG